MIPHLIIFDADGTLRRCTVPGQPCPNTPDQWELMPNVKEKLADLTGTAFAIVSNQAGVALGYMTEEVAYSLLKDMVFAAFPEGDAHFVNIEMCPHAPSEECDCRKPKPRLVERCMNLAMCPPEQTLFVGDMGSDLQTARNAGCAFMWAEDFFGWDTNKQEE